MKIGILTCDKCPGLAPRDQHLIPLFEQQNIETDNLVWNDPKVDWNAYDGLIFRSVWDYHLLPKQFDGWLNFMEAKNIPTLNPIPVIRNNQHKFYLRQLQQQGVTIVPTVFIDKTQNLDLSAVTERNWHQAVIKPAISASSYLTTMFNAAEAQQIEDRYRSVAAERDLLLQPFMPEIIANGEISLIFFNRKYSHAVTKSADEGDFRVQAEFGGKHEAIHPTKNIIEAAEYILSLIAGPLLYARVDGIIQNNQFMLMELELIEPDLYFDADVLASKRYVDSAIELLKH